MRYAIVSDIHANWDALETVLNDAGDVDQVWCLGDIVDMGPEPNECVEALRARSAVCIFGNHEEWVSDTMPQRIRETPMLEGWARWTRARLSADNLTFLEALPEQITLGAFTLLHYPHASFDPPAVGDLTRFASRYCLVGHTHLPLVCRYPTNGAGAASVQISRPPTGEPMVLDDDRAIVNVGSVGASFTDPRLACYLMLDEPAGGDAPMLTFRAVAYPVQSFLDKLRDFDIPAELAAGRQLGFDRPNPARERVAALYREWYPEV